MVEHTLPMDISQCLSNTLLVQPVNIRLFMGKYFYCIYLNKNALSINLNCVYCRYNREESVLSGSGGSSGSDHLTAKELGNYLYK